jgi:hypothetical protein
VIFGRHCCLCEATEGEKILVQIIERGSGPGWSLYACPTPCAQEYASRTYAPEWLQKDLAKMGLWPVED